MDLVTRASQPVHPGLLLNKLFTAKQAARAAYSLTAFARDLDISKATLSKILAGLQIPTPLVTEKILHRLEPKENILNEIYFSICYHSLPSESSRRYFLDVQRSARVSGAKFRQALENKYEVLDRWYHVAILDLMTLPDAESNIEWIARQLKIKPDEASSAVSILFRLGLLEEKNDRWNKTEKRLEFPTAHSRASVRAFHRQMIEKAQAALAEGEKNFERRLITGLSVATTPEKIEAAKTYLESSLKEIMKILETDEASEIYQLNLQLFPLTERERK